MPIELTLYRGEKEQWWPEPSIRLISGMTIYGRWLPSDINSLWEKLKQEIVEQPGQDLNQKVAAYAQYLRASGHPFALATARTLDGAYEFDYNYVISIPEAYLFYWGGTIDVPEIGEPVPDDLEVIDADYIVLNAETIEDSTILGFGHNTLTQEVTFFHDLPINFVISCNEESINEINISTIEDLDPFGDIKMKYRNIFRE